MRVGGGSLLSLMDQCYTRKLCVIQTPGAEASVERPKQHFNPTCHETDLYRMYYVFFRITKYWRYPEIAVLPIQPNQAA